MLKRGKHGKLPRIGSSWSIGKRLNVGFGVVLTLMAIVGSLAWMQFARQDDRIRKVVDVDAWRTSLAQQMQLAVKDVVITLANLCVLEDELDLADERKAFQAALTRYETARKALDGSLAADTLSPVLKAMDDVNSAQAEAMPIFMKMAEFEGSNGREAQADYYYTRVSGPQRNWQQNLHKLDAALRSAMTTAVAASHQASKQVQRAIGGLLGVALTIGFAAAWRIRRSIVGALGEAVAVARAVAGGDLASEVPTDRDDEIGALMRSLAEMQAGLRLLVGDIQACADSIHTASDEVAGGNADLSQRTEVAASNLSKPRRPWRT